jgi:hypothetical protein
MESPMYEYSMSIVDQAPSADKRHLDSISECFIVKCGVAEGLELFSSRATTVAHG